MRRIERHQRGETVAPVGDVVEQFGIMRLIRVEHDKMRADGPGICQRHADVEAIMRRRVVERIKLQRVMLFGDDDAGRIVALFNPRVFLGCQFALDAIDRQARQPQAENPPPRVR